jgi:hypothetical protein
MSTTTSLIAVALFNLPSRSSFTIQLFRKQNRLNVPVYVSNLVHVHGILLRDRELCHVPGIFSSRKQILELSSGLIITFEWQFPDQAALIII